MSTPEQSIIDEVQKLREENMELRVQLAGVSVTQEIALGPNDERCFLGHAYDRNVNEGRCWCGHGPSGVSQ